MLQNDATKHTNTLRMAIFEENQSDVSLINNSSISISGNNMYGGIKLYNIVIFVVQYII
jgi:hypothetical protein